MFSHQIPEKFRELHIEMEVRESEPWGYGTKPKKQLFVALKFGFATLSEQRIDLEDLQE